MRYFEWINKYLREELSVTDQQAFEHELEENKVLHDEMEAMTLMEALLVEVSSNRMLNSSDTIVKGNKWPKYFLLGTTFVIFVVIGLVLTVPSSIPEEEQSPPPSIDQNWNPAYLPKDTEPTLKNPPIADLKNEPLEKHRKIDQDIKVAMQTSHSIKKINQTSDFPKIQKIASKESSLSTNAIEIYTVKAVLDSVISAKSNLALTATEAITLKPGFHVKTGASFKAKIDQSPLFSNASDLDD